jgi:hypothetical protein
MSIKKPNILAKRECWKGLGTPLVEVKEDVLKEVKNSSPDWVCFIYPIHTPSLFNKLSKNKQ